MNTLGLDIGGANLKAADGRGHAVQVPFPLWKNPERLETELRSLIALFPRLDRVGVTMTGELCDCFPSKAAGVRHILASVVAAVQVPLLVWSTDGKFIAVDEAHANPPRVAAANWLGLAVFAARFVPTGNGLLIDLGSTTCDIIPLSEGKPTPQGRTDPARFKSGELVYCGVRRTPLCAIFGLAKAAEWFATTADAYVVLGDLPEEPERTDTADGRPLTRAHSQTRLARMDCDEDWSREQTLALAEEARDAQVRRIADSVRKVAALLPGGVDFVVSAGAGEFLIPAILEASGCAMARRISLAERLGPLLSTAACAHAVACLAGEPS